MIRHGPDLGSRGSVRSMLRAGAGEGARPRGRARGRGGRGPASEADRAEVLAVPAGARGRGAHAGQDILLDDDPAAVAPRGESGRHRRKVDRAASELAEDSPPDRFEVVPPPLPGLPRDGGIAVLEVDVPGAIR